MGLLQNISLKYAEPYDRTGDTSEFWPSQLNWGMNKYVNIAQLDQKSGVPEGYVPPYSFLLAIKEGGLSSFVQIQGNGDISANLVKGINFSANTLTGFGEISNVSNLTSLIRLIAALIGQGEISATSTMKGFANMLASILASGETTNSSTLSGLNRMYANISGSGEIDSSTTLKGFANMLSSILASGEINNISALLGINRLYANISGSGEIDSTTVLKAIANLSSLIEGSGQINDSSLFLFAQLVANLSGSGKIDSSSMLLAIAFMNATLSGSGKIDNSPLGLIAWCIANLPGSGDLSGTMKGWSSMSSEIKSYGELTVEGLRDAIWNAIANNYNDPGSMGNKVNAAGTAGDPWTADLSHYAEGTAGNKLNSIELTEQDKIDIVNRIWNEEIIHHQTVGSTGNFLLDIKKVTINKVTRLGDIITIYESDGITVWKRFNLAGRGRIEI